LPSKIRSKIVNDGVLNSGRERIARNAIAVIAKKGYGNTSTRELAEACGMSEAAMYRYVGTKADILHLISDRMLGFGFRLKEFVDSLENKRKSEILCESWRYYVSLVDKEEDMVMVVHREIVNLSQKDRDHQMNLLAVYIFERIIRDGIEDGEFSCDDPELVAYMMWTLAHDWALKRWFLRRHINMEQYIEQFMKIFLRSLRVSADQAIATEEVPT